MSTIWETGSTKCTHHDYLKANSIYVYIEKSCKSIFFQELILKNQKVLHMVTPLSIMAEDKSIYDGYKKEGWLDEQMV